MQISKKKIEAKIKEVGEKTKFCSPLLDIFKGIKIGSIFTNLKAAFIFVIAPFFTAKTKAGELEFKAPYAYVFFLMVALFVSIGQLIFMVHQVAFSVVNEPAVVLAACGGQVATLIIVIDRMMTAYNKGKSGSNDV